MPNARLSPAPATVHDHALQELLRLTADMQALRRGTSTWQYRSIEAAVLAQGGFVALDRKLHGKVHRGPLKACFNNAFHAAIERGDLTYCEGYALVLDLPLAFHHAWVIDPEGAIGETTWEEPGTAYLGIPFSLEFVRRTVSADSTSVLDDPRRRHPLLRDGFPTGAVLRFDKLSL